MRVALVSSGSGSRGGGEIYLRLLAEGLTARGDEIVSIVPAHMRMDELAAELACYGPVERPSLTATYDRPIRGLAAVVDRDQRRRTAALFAGLGVEVVHINQQVAEDGLDLVLAAAASGVAWLSTIHVARSAESLGARLGNLRDLVTHRTLRGTAGLHLAVADAARKMLQERFGSNGPNVLTVHNGVRAPTPAALAEARKAARREWVCADRVVVVGTVGRIEAQKNPEGLIAAVSPLISDGLEMRVIWIGDGTGRAALEALASRVGVPLRVDGWRDDASLRMAGFDIFAMTSRYEGLPLALIEAMHAGLPIIAAPADGIPEALEHGISGVLPPELAAWPNALAVLVGDAELRSRLGAAARQRAAVRFSLEAMATKTEAAYRMVLRPTA